MAFDLATAKPVGGFDLSTAKPVIAPKTSVVDDLKQGAGNLVAGAVRGAGSIGATLLAPIDIAKDALDGKGLSLESNRKRRSDMDAALQTMGAEPDSLTYKGAKLGTEILGTWPVAGVVANGARVAGAAPELVNAIRTTGLTTGGGSGVTNMLTRMTGGAIGAGATGLAINPEDAVKSAAVGAVLPPAVAATGKVVNALGKAISGPEVSDAVRTGVQAARDAGYVVPPTQANPTLLNRIIEGTAGKITTAQNASAANQFVTNKLSAKAVGLPEDAQITADALEAIRKTAGEAYKDVAALPVRPAQAAYPLTNTPAIAEINPTQMVFDLRKARNDATAWFKSYGRTADPDALAKATAAKNEATNLQNTLEQYAKSLGRDDLVQKMVEARQLIAKTHTVEGALNQTSGTVNAQKLAADLKKGKPLSGELKQAAEFAAQFPKAAQPIESMGSLPQLSPLDWAASGAISAATQNPLMLATLLARPATRKLALSSVVQNRLASQPGSNALANLLNRNQDIVQLGYQAIPRVADR